MVRFPASKLLRIIADAEYVAKVKKGFELTVKALPDCMFLLKESVLV